MNNIIKVFTDKIKIGKFNINVKGTLGFNSENKKTYTEEQQKALFIHSMNYACPIKPLDEYPKYMINNYNIKNPKIFHEKMIKEGFFEQASFYESIKHLKKEELIKIANNINLKTKKLTKNEIIELLNKNSTKINLGKNYYVVSNKGKMILENNDAFLQLYDNPNWNITLEEYLKYKKELPKYLKFNDIIWHIFMVHYNSSDILKKRNIDFERAIF